MSLPANVLASQRRRQRHLRVPMIRQADDHRVNVRARQQFMVIRVNRDFRHAQIIIPMQLLHRRLAGRRAFGIQIAHRHHVRQIRLHHARHVMNGGNPAATNMPDPHAIARRIGPEQAAGNNQRKRQRTRSYSRPPQKIPARELGGFVFAHSVKNGGLSAFPQNSSARIIA
jgi:hypothetical protein